MMPQRAYRMVLLSLVLTAAVVWGTMSIIGQSGSNAPYFPSVAKGDWPAYTGDNTGARYSPQTQITAENFNKLEVAWRFKTDSLGPKPEFKLGGTPLVVKGVMYATAGTRRDVVALRADTGEVMWVHAEFEIGRAHV